MLLGIIGGSGLTALEDLTEVRHQAVRTPYGEPSGVLTFGKLAGREVVFIARHGYGHTLAPHQINYRANIWALKSVGVSEVLAVASVGGITERYRPGVLVVPHQIIDYTWGRANTFFDGVDDPVVHIDFTQPFSSLLREKLLEAAHRCGEVVMGQGVYACTQGPRLETAAEIERLARDGADIVGMTMMPEAVLAREAGLAYAALNIVANDAAGRGNASTGINLEALHEVLATGLMRARRILLSYCALGLG